MKKIVFCIFSLLLLFTKTQANSLSIAPYLPAQDGKKAPITVQHPQENMRMSAGAKNIYLFGKLNLSQPTLEINGQSVPVHKNGTFIAYIPVQQGPFSILLTATSKGKTYQAIRNIQVPGTPIDQFIGKARLDETSAFPTKPVWLQAADTLSLSVRGTPSARVHATLHGLKHAHTIVLKENPRFPGTYQGKYTISEKEKPRSFKVSYHLQDPATDTHTKITAKQRIKILDPKTWQIGLVKDPSVKLRQLPVHQGSLYPFYRAFGQVKINGRENGLYRLLLGNGEEAWLEESKIALTSGKTVTNTLTQIQTFSTPTHTQIRWQATQQVPISIHEFNNRIEVAFYYTDTFEENFDFDATSPLIDHITWSEPKDGVLTFTIYLQEDSLLWGHAYQYEENNFVVDLKHQPIITPTPKKPLQGARILLDAGHSPKRVPPYDGLVSPSGFLEYEANLALAEVLKPKLEKVGATVIMTRQGDNQMSLPQRYHKALEQQAHIFISLHHNALPDTFNPRSMERGYSIYYTYPHSFNLAQSIYQTFNAKIPLADNGLIANDILFIPRICEMPSILIENAFMILPEQEEFVMSQKGRELFAQTIYEGILQFYKSTFPSPDAKRKK